MIKTINQFISYKPKPINIHKTSDYFIEVVFKWGEVVWNGVIPTEYRYYGKNVNKDDDELIKEWIAECYQSLAPDNIAEWKKEQRDFWNLPSNNRSLRTQEVFEVLNNDDKLSTWKCRTHETSQTNDQAAARIKNLKERGYVIITQKKHCDTCDKNTFFDILVRLPRLPAGAVNRYSISSNLAKRILQTLEYKDVFFNTVRPGKELVIDHKFPSTRWKSGELENKNSMSKIEIKHKFQLLTNQSNLLKERHCQRCIKDGIRGNFLGIKWYYQGNEYFNGSSEHDENGCIGCPWYDLDEWKNKLEQSARHI